MPSCGRKKRGSSILDLRENAGIGDSFGISGFGAAQDTKWGVGFLDGDANGKFYRVAERAGDEVFPSREPT